MPHYNEDKKAPATGILGTVLGATALGVGALGGFSGYGGGLFSMFGGNRGGGGFAGPDATSPMAVYIKQQENCGQQAITELHIAEKWLMPLMGRVCDLEKENAVTKATTPLLVALQGAQFQGELDKAMCCVVKGRPMIVPEQIGDQYHGAYNELVTRHHSRHPHNNDCAPFGPFGRDYGRGRGCGCGGHGKGY